MAGGLTLNWFQQHVDANAEHVSETSSIFGRMATIVFATVSLRSQGEGVQDEQNKHVVVKRVVPSELEGNEEALLASSKREVAFYEKFGSELAALGLGPKVYGHESSAEGILLCMEDLSRAGFFQIKEVEQDIHVQWTLKSFAKLCSGERLLEAMEWREHLDSKVSAHEIDRERGGFWVLARRSQEELDNAKETWAGVMDRFGSFLFGEDHATLENAKAFGPRLAEMAKQLDEIARDCAGGFVHGDAKSWNLFFAPEDDTFRAKVIDLQWQGYGHPLQDLVYFLTTSVPARKLGQAGVWERYVDQFHDLIKANLQEVWAIGESRGLDMASHEKRLLTQSSKAFQDLSKILWLDYVRVICFGLWKRLDMGRMESNKNKIGISLVTSSAEQMKWIIETACAQQPELHAFSEYFKKLN